MYAVDGVCPCCDPFAGAGVRAVLEAACRALPPRAARELRTVLAPLDARFLARTLADPFARPLPDSARSQGRGRFSRR